MAAGINPAETRTAFHQYLSNLDSSCPTEERTMEYPRTLTRASGSMVVGGVYALVEESVRLVTLGSTSRGIPYKEWTIPLPSAAARDCCFHPPADIIAFVELQEETYVYLVIEIVAAGSPRRSENIVIHLRTLSSGGLHPAARCPTILYSQEGGDAIKISVISVVSISSSQLAVLTRAVHGTYMVIWDWRNAQVLFVR